MGHGVCGQVGGPLRQRGIAGLCRNPLHMLVALAGTCGRAAVVKAQAAQGAEQLGQHLKIAPFQGGQLLGEGAPCQHQVVQADRKLVQHDGVLRADGADGKRWIGVQKRVEIGVARPAGQHDAAGVVWRWCGGSGFDRILARQGLGPAHDEAQAVLCDLSLAGLQGAECAAGQGAVGAAANGGHPVGLHGAVSSVQNAPCYRRASPPMDCPSGYFPGLCVLEKPRAVRFTGAGARSRCCPSPCRADRRGGPPAPSVAGRCGRCARPGHPRPGPGTGSKPNPARHRAHRAR